MEIDFKALFKELPNRPLLTLTEVSKFLGVSRRTVYRWYPAVLSGTNIRGSIRIYRVAVVEMVIQNHCRRESDEVNEKPDKPTKPVKGSKWVKNW